jgi:DNA/RNA-binding domain of Phe-tRNA-synthetase-like protein
LDILVDPHPLLDLAVWIARFPAPLIECPRTSALQIADVPLTADDHVRAAVRDLLRSPDFKPTGRNKPASEYLVRAVGEGSLGAINLAVDICNLCSFHSGLPMSVVDMDRVQPPLRVGLAPAGARYIFNSAGQTIDVAGLLGLSDALGPCANPVKDAQRTKTHAQTRNALYLVWGTRTLPQRTSETATWCRGLLASCNVACEDIEIRT